MIPQVPKLVENHPRALSRSSGRENWAKSTSRQGAHSQGHDLGVGAILADDNLSVSVNAHDFSAGSAFNKFVLAVAFAFVLEQTSFFLEGANFLADFSLAAAIVTTDQLATLGEEGGGWAVNSGRAVNLYVALVFMNGWGWGTL